MTYSPHSSRCSTQPSPWRRSAVFLAISGAMLACSGDLDERDLGNTESELAAADAVSTSTHRMPIVGAEGSVDPFIEGEWLGHAEDLFSPAGAGERPVYTFPSGSTSFRLTIGLADPTAPTAVMVFGSGPVPEAQPGVPYPPGFDAERAMPLDGSIELQLAPQEGRIYPMSESIIRQGGDSGVAAGVLAFSYISNQTYWDWCQLQPPRALGNGQFNCATASDPSDSSARCATEAEDGTVTKFDCDLLYLCDARNICECNETECHGAPAASHHLWLIREGDDLVGTWVGAVFDYGDPARFLPVGSVRFERVNP